MMVKVYDKPGCPKCRMTERKLTQSGANFITKTLLRTDNMDYSDKKISEFKSQGFKSFPIVEVYDEHGSKVDSWCDLRMDKLNKYFD